MNKIPKYVLSHLSHYKDDKVNVLPIVPNTLQQRVEDVQCWHKLGPGQCLEVFKINVNNVSWDYGVSKYVHVVPEI